MRSYCYNLGQRFSAVAKQQPEATALAYADGRIFTFAWLEKRSNQFAHYLLKQGFKPADRAAIFNTKNPEAFALMLGCVKIGVTYANLDYTSPAARLQKILSRCEARKLFDFTQQQQLKQCLVEVDDCTDTPVPILDAITGDTAAYIMFTSGSTGFPKGAAIAHSSVLNFIDWGKQTYSITPTDRLTNVNAIYFDNSVFDFYVSLFNGASLVPFTLEEAQSTTSICTIIERMQPTLWFSVPSLLVYLLTTKSLKSETCKSLKGIIFGGEGFPKKKLQQLFNLTEEQGTTLYNVYGPTECTCICSSRPIVAEDFNDLEKLAPLGTLALNFDYYLHEARETADGTVGELCLLGPQVSLGYVNDPDNTEKSFVLYPDSKGLKRTMYKTGDLVRLDANKEFHFVGRADNQIKFMGYRIELEEIEAAVNTLSFVEECCVIYQNREGLSKIIAHVATKEDVQSEKILQDLKGLLPQYMLPRSIQIWPSLPKNKNGKIDRVHLLEAK